jgi:hypothetical protein
MLSPLLKFPAQPSAVSVMVEEHVACTAVFHQLQFIHCCVDDGPAPAAASEVNTSQEKEREPNEFSQTPPFEQDVTRKAVSHLLSHFLCRCCADGASFAELAGYRGRRRGENGSDDEHDRDRHRDR